MARSPVIVQPDAGALRAFLARTARRLAWLSAARGAAVGLAVAIIATLIRWPRFSIVGSVALAALGAAVSVVWS
ncbi:MAG: hypothetical protein ACREPM_03970, partial [Gemmatimonadaceae bacterium]